jgi:hypothetical protein
MAIPPRVHFIFGLSPDFGGKPFSYAHYLCVRSAKAVNPDCEVVFHVAHEPSGGWWDAIRPGVTLNKVEPPTAILGRPLRHFAHQADALRLEILLSEGGIYLDIDVFCVRPFSPLLDRGMVMAIEPRQGLCNAVMLAEPRAPFLDLWFETYRDFDGKNWNAHSVRKPYQLARQHPDLIDVLDEYAFFFPTHNDPSCARLWSPRLAPDAYLRSALLDLTHALRPTGATRPKRRVPLLRHALWSSDRYYAQLRQSYCIHLWESLWWDAFLGDLSPETMRASGGLFPRLVEEVLGDEPGRVTACAPSGRRDDAASRRAPTG